MSVHLHFQQVLHHHQLHSTLAITGHFSMAFGFLNDWASSLTLGSTGILDASCSLPLVLHPHCVARGLNPPRWTHCWCLNEETNPLWKHSQLFSKYVLVSCLVAHTMCCIKILFRKFTCWAVSSINSTRNEPTSVS